MTLYHLNQTKKTILLFGFNMGVIDFSNREQSLRRGDKIEMLVMYCGEIIKIASYQWDD
ncbi:hypothetical protein I33_2714 [Bacillus subtilis subsp. subtilis str. RO-NN-1]|nr:hypothetical protein I33_2714 [Bacillus subtilis subsp. subtilis str. RO-NN-1]